MKDILPQKSGAICFPRFSPGKSEKRKPVWNRLRHVHMENGRPLKLNKAIVGIKLRPRFAICCRCIRRIQRGAVWRIRWKFVTTCFSTATTSILPTSRARGPVVVKSWRHLQNRKYITYFRCRQRRTEPRSRITRAENFVKFEVWTSRSLSLFWVAAEQKGGQGWG